MAHLGLLPGDCVRLTARTSTHARVLPDPAGEQRIATDSIVAANIGAVWGDHATVVPATLPALDRMTLRGRTRAAGFGPDPDLVGMAVSVGDRLQLAKGGVPGDAHTVLDLAPAPAGLVHGRTRIDWSEAARATGSLRGVGGLSQQIARVLELVELPLDRPDLFAALGITPPRGLLFVGPPGTGKTLVARAIADRTRATFFEIAATEILSKHYGESEAALRKLFDEAARKAPAILFIDEIDAIAPRREGLSAEKQVERRIVGQLLALMDGLGPRGHVIVIAATNLPDALDPALRRPGRFDREIVFGSPDAADRAEILSVHLAGSPLAADVDLAALALRAHGFTGADLSALAVEGAMAALARATAEAGSPAAVQPEGLAITQADLDAALDRLSPSTLRGVATGDEGPGWDDIGGLDREKAALAQSVIWPISHRALARSLRVELPRGILMAGPPGTGKTMLARALARESGLTMVAVSAGDLLSPHLGEVERAIADLFRRLRASAPCLLFLDEIDALAPRRGSSDAAFDRIVAQLLTELDGLRSAVDLVVVAATNRPEAVDAAIRRAGRLDLILPFGPPDSAARAQIIAVHLRDRPVDPAVDVAGLAARTEGWSGADLAALAGDAARLAFERAVTADAGPGEVAITGADLTLALARQSARRAAAAAPVPIG
jgi:transitional endoplasmic reticulum ATPase